MNQSVSQILMNHTLLNTLGMIGVVYCGYSLYSKFTYQNKIHKEIKQIIKHYSKNAKTNDQIDESINNNVLAFKLTSFEPNKEWQVDLSNKEILCAINELQNEFSLSEISITISKYPYNNRVIIERNNHNNFKIHFDD